MLNFKYCRRLACLSSSKFTKCSFFATKRDRWRAVRENTYYIRYVYIYIRMSFFQTVQTTVDRRRTKANLVCPLSFGLGISTRAYVKSTVRLSFSFPHRSQLPSCWHHRSYPKEHAEGDYCNRFFA